MIRRSAAVLAAALTLLPVAACSSSSDGGTATSSASSASSSTTGEVVRMWIEPELVECVGVGPMECMQVAYSDGGPTELFYDSIEGFTFTEGTAYVIDVQVTPVADPPADGSSLAYSLLEVVSEQPQ